MSSRRRSSIVFASLLLATGCGLVVGVKDLEVDAKPIAVDDDDDVRAEAGPSVPDAGRPDRATADVPDADAGCALKSVPNAKPSTHRAGGDGTGWVDGFRAFATNDGSQPAAYTPSPGELGSTSKELRLAGFDFQLPVMATIKGFKVEIRGRSSVANVYRDLSVKLSVPGVGASGTEHRKPEPYPFEFQDRVYGGVDDLWGVTLTAEQVNQLDFGVALRLQRDGDGFLDEVYGGYDLVQMTVYFCEP